VVRWIISDSYYSRRQTGGQECLSRTSFLEDVGLYFEGQPKAAVSVALRETELCLSQELFLVGKIALKKSAILPKFIDPA
jgi:hypothetical protein